MAKVQKINNMELMSKIYDTQYIDHEFESYSLEDEQVNKAWFAIDDDTFIIYENETFYLEKFGARELLDDEISKEWFEVMEDLFRCEFEYEIDEAKREQAEWSRLSYQEDAGLSR